MSNLKELYTRQMIWAEYRSGSSKEQARAKLGLDTISEETIDTFYQRFKSGNISLVDQDNVQHYVPQVIQTLPNGDEKNFAESIFFTSNDPELVSEMYDTNGRFAIFCARKSYGNTKIVFADLFHGEVKSVDITPQANYGKIESVNIIGQQHLLISTSRGLILLKVDWTTWQANFVSRPDSGLDGIYDVVVDQSDRSKICVSGWTEFVTGTLVGDKIIFSPRKEFMMYRLKFAKLIDNQLCKLLCTTHNRAGAFSSYYRKIDLATLTEEKIDVSIPFNERLGIYSCKISNYFQVGTRFYVAFYGKNDKVHIFAFNTETLIWQDTGIVVYGEVLSYSFDQNEILTLQVAECHFAKNSTFYRFALKKPDSLKNLAWLTIRRSAVLFSSDLYDRIRSRLPYGRGLRSLFISDFE